MRMKLPVPYEAEESKVLAQWLDMRGIRYCHVPNGELRSKRTAAKLRCMGVKPGVPDFLIFDPPPGAEYIGTAIEMKRQKGGKVSGEQATWHAALRVLGWSVIVTAGADAAIRWLQEMGY